MFHLIKELSTSVMSFASYLINKMERSLNRVGFSGWSIVVILVIVGACFGMIAPIGSGSAPPPPPNFGMEITQVVPSPDVVDYVNNASIPAKIEMNLRNVQRTAESQVNNGGSTQKCGISKNPHNTSTIARNNHFDINFDLSVTHRKCACKLKLWQDTSTGPVIVEVRPYVIDGWVKLKTEVVKTDMPNIYGVKNIRSEVKDELKSMFKKNIDDKYFWELPKGASAVHFEFTNVSGGDIILKIDLLVPMPGSVPPTGAGT